jgi:methyl-accepting chemotaxis protein
MIFFAMIAIVAILADWRAIVAAAATTAVHHLVLNFVAPSLVFSGGADFWRVVMHAAVVIAEANVLIALTMKLESGLARQATAQAEKDLLQRCNETERDRRELEQRRVVERIDTALLALAAGDLTHRIDDEFPANFDKLRINYNQSAKGLNGLVGGGAAASQQIEIGTAEIRISSQDLARRTEKQATFVEHATSTLSNLAGAALATARSAGKVNDALATAQDNATVGQKIVKRAISTMALIQKSASEIGNIVALIDGIAFQTNLLALNAGVEAARAGDSGKGFAVVANEVRALAQRSANAAMDIKALITASNQQVDEGVSLVMQTGDALKDIMLHVSGIGSAVQDISHAAHGNANDLVELDRTFGVIDTSTQQNATMVEENTEALGALSNQTTELMSMVDRFHCERKVSSSGVQSGKRSLGRAA